MSGDASKHEIGSRQPDSNPPDSTRTDSAAPDSVSVDSVAPDSDSPDSSRRNKRTLLSRWRVLLSVVTVCSLIVTVSWIQMGLGFAESALRARDYESARSAAERYLWLHPGDVRARMVAAQGYSLDDRLHPDIAAQKAIEHLEAVPDTAAQAAEARMLQGRLTFLILLQPTRAEKLFHRAVELNPDQFDSHYLLWKLHDMTERYFDSEPHFRDTFRLVPDEQKAFRLREWYLSQFNPLSACAELDAMMGFREPTQPTSEAVNYLRLTTFAEKEPNSPVVAAAIAQAQLRNRQRDVALETLEKLPNCDNLKEPFFVATLAEVLLELGQLDRAKAVFANWPRPAGGYRFWRISGMIAQVADADFAQAADFYELALADWPGPSDWLTIHRWFRCLALQGKTEASEEIRKRSEEIENLMELEAHQRQKEALAHLDDPIRLKIIVDFYTSLNRPWEQQQWQAVIDRLPRQPSL